MPGDPATAGCCGVAPRFRSSHPRSPWPWDCRDRTRMRRALQSACVGAVWSIEPFVRGADDIHDEVLRGELSGAIAAFGRATGLPTASRLDHAGFYVDLATGPVSNT